ncbi:MAG TPA: SulP family inorganic anion transporter [Flavilitoribacter sp.]|nr:SulP family inorganic anion transporter [Flavilitoribacter sp.]
MEKTDKIPSGIFKNLKSDLPASIVVFLVALPLCLGIALASGAPLFAGIIAGIVGGIVVGAFSGSQLGVSGPAAGLAVIVLVAIQDLGSYQTFLLAVVLAGLIQIALGFARAGIIGYYFPSSVIKGMLSGIGIIIILKQIPHAFGYDKDYEGSLEFAQPDGQNTLSELLNMVNFITPGAVIIAAVSLFILILWEQKFMKRQRIFQLIQGPLVAVAAGILLNLAFQSNPNLGLNPEHLVTLPVAESLSGFFAQFTFPDFSHIADPRIYMTAMTMAVVASLETLLCLEATDKLDPYKRVTPANRELQAQGIGNMISGLIGGLPITQVIVRSSTNIQSGGRTKASAIFHGVLLLVSVMSIPRLLNLIPLASLAAILFVVGYKLAKPALFKQMYKLGWAQFVPFVVTIVGIVLTDLLIGIGLGLAVAIFYILRNNYKKPYFFHPEEHANGEVIRIELAEDVTFLNKADILQTLNHLPENSRVVIDASRTVNIDQDVIEIVEDFESVAPLRNIDLTVIGRKLKGLQERPVKVFEKTIVNSAVLNN